jgi:hypothetical protein
VTVFEFSRIAFRRYRWAALFCALLTVGCAMLASEVAPALYPAEAQVLMVEPVMVHRLANPFAPVPSSSKELAEVPELLRSRERLVSIVKRTGLMDQWSQGRPWPLKLKDRALEAVVGPMSEADRLEALVTLVDKRLSVSVEGSKVRIVARWNSPELAMALVENTLGTLLQLRAQREGKTLQDAAEALDTQYDSVRKEMNERARRLENTLSQPGGWATIEGDREQLVRDQSRVAELLVSSEEKHIAAEVFRQSNNLRFLVVRPVIRPREPLGAGPVLRVAMIALAALLVCAVATLLLGVLSGRLLSRRQLSSTVGLTSFGTVRLPSRTWVFPTGRGAALAGLLAVLTGAVAGSSRATPALALLVPLAFVVGWLMWTRPLKWPFLIMVLLAVTVDDPTDRAYSTLWQSPLFPLGRVLFTNIALFTGFELLIVGLTAFMLLRRLVLPREVLARLDPIQGLAPRPLQLSLVVSAISLGLLIAMGLARGGVFREALWQFRALLMMPFAATLALYALELPKDLPKLFAVLVGGSLLKALLGIFFMYFIAFPRGVYPPHTTGHNDTMIFVTAVVSALTLFFEKPIRRHFWLILMWLPPIALAMRLNDRRIAYVDIVLALGAIIWLSPMNEMKLKLKKLVVALSPLLFVYVIAGWNQQTSKVFAPVQKVRSIVAPAQDTEEESSNVERDIENYNLMKSWERDMLFGQGFGHAFTEFVLSNDFKQSNFGHVGHNSILWLWWIGGVFGFTAVMGYLVVGLYFLGRALPATKDWRERVALFVSLSIIVTYLMQAFGDMGTQSVMFDFFVGIALAIVGRFATRANAWSRSAVARVVAQPAA